MNVYALDRRVLQTGLGMVFFRSVQRSVFYATLTPLDKQGGDGEEVIVLNRYASLQVMHGLVLRPSWQAKWSRWLLGVNDLVTAITYNQVVDHKLTPWVN